MIASRRKFLFGAAALALAPALVRAENIMRIKPPTLILYGDGVHDDTHAVNALISGEKVWSGVLRRYIAPEGNDIHVPFGTHRMTGSIRVAGDGHINFGGGTFDFSDAPDGTYGIWVKGPCEGTVSEIHIHNVHGLACAT